MSEIKQFKTESKRLLDMMINSIYTNQEIFLRELISNASDAIDKYHFLSLTDEKLTRRNDYQILIETNEEERTLTISDNGIGMTYDELNDSLGTIAKSGSKEFIEKMKNDNGNSEIEIIGQFGVGFYSAFMVAKKIEVDTLSPYSEQAYRFSSEGTETYEVSKIEKNNVGTTIKLYLRDNTEDVYYDEFLDEYRLRELVRKYSDYVRYPIQMLITQEEPKFDEEGNIIEDEYETTTELTTLNSMTPIWKKNRSEVTDEELNEFYKNKFYDFQDPEASILINVEGAVTYTALIFIPKKPPYNLYSENYEKGLQLYSKGVFIMEKCKELVPDYLRFIKGLVDSSDLSLNISREILQQNRQLEKISSNVEKRILSRLENMLKNEREQYIEFFKNYGVNLKFGIYDQFGVKKDLLKDLILYNSVNNEQMITLAEYVEAMPEHQEFIYYASGKNKNAVLAMPQMDLIKKQGFDVLVLTDEIDEFAINVLEEYNEKKFKSINQGELDLLTEEEEKMLEELRESKKPFLEKLKEVLADKVDDVILSKRLTDSPVCLVSGEGISFEMEKVIASMPDNDKLKATRILEVNPNHELFSALEAIYNKNSNELAIYADILYSQALLIEGFNLEDPVDFSRKLSDLIVKSVK